MIGRRVPPVHSPIAVSALPAAALRIAMPAPEIAVSVRAALAARFDARAVLLTDTGTSALVLALRAISGTGGIVAMPAYACIDLITAAIGAGVRVRLYDVEAATLGPDLDSLERVLRVGAAAVVIAPLYGYPVDAPAVAALCARYGARLIEDAAQAAGATLDQRRVGSFGDVSILSFGRGKGTTCGSGGALLSRASDLTASMSRLHSSLPAGNRGGRDVVALGAQWLFGRPSLYGIPASIPAFRLGEMVFHDPHEPRHINSSALGALPSALAHDDAEIAIRRRHAARLLVAIADRAKFTPVLAIAHSLPGYLRFAMLGAATTRQAPRLGVLRGYPCTLAEHSASRRVLLEDEGPLPGATTLRDRLFTAPTHSRLAERDLAALEGLLRGARA